jgi:Polyketide cyclase / dehydrase and lipid transport
MKDLVRFTVTGGCSHGVEATYWAILEVDLKILFAGWGPLPAVLGIKDERGRWDHPGATRRPQLSDGSSALETLTEVYPPDSFVYEISEITGLLGKLVAWVHSEWEFTSVTGGTSVRWLYEVHPRPRRGLLVRFGLGPLWRAYMRRSLARVLAEVDRQQRQAR